MEAIVDGQIGALFRRLPILHGFSVQQDLQPAEVVIHSWPGYVASVDLYDEIVIALADLVAERPEAADLMRGRTFARHLQ